MAPGDRRAMHYEGRSNGKSARRRTGGEGKEGDPERERERERESTSRAREIGMKRGGPEEYEAREGTRSAASSAPREGGRRWRGVRTATQSPLHLLSLFLSVFLRALARSPSVARALRLKQRRSLSLRCWAREMRRGAAWPRRCGRGQDTTTTPPRASLLSLSL